MELKVINTYCWHITVLWKYFLSIKLHHTSMYCLHQDNVSGV